MKRATTCDLRDWDKKFNTEIAKIRALNEQAVAHFKGWRMMSDEGGRCRIPSTIRRNTSSDYRAHVLQVIYISLPVLCRESWRFSAADVPVRSSGGDDVRYRDLRSWAEEQGIPRPFFVKTAAEPKPMYVDLRAPLLVDNLARVVRRARAGGDAGAAQVEITEMLPGPDELWLADAAGKRYTSEFRVAAQESMPVVRARAKGDAGPVASP